MKILSVLSVLVLVTGVCLVMTACNSKKSQVDAAMVDIKAMGGSYTSSMQDDVLKIEVTQGTKDIEFDFTKFFKENPEYIGKNFYFTRSDVFKGDNTLIKGAAWVEHDKDNGNRRFVKLGKEFNEEKGTPKTRGEIAALEEHEGKARMYILKDGKHLLYYDHTPESNIKSSPEPVTIRFHGHHGRVAELKVQVVK